MENADAGIHWSWLRRRDDDDDNDDDDDERGEEEGAEQEGRGIEDPTTFVQHQRTERRPYTDLAAQQRHWRILLCHRRYMALASSSVRSGFLLFLCIINRASIQSQWALKSSMTAVTWHCGNAGRYGRSQPKVTASVCHAEGEKTSECFSATDHLAKLNFRIGHIEQTAQRHASQAAISHYTVRRSACHNRQTNIRPPTIMYASVKRLSFFYWTLLWLCREGFIVMFMSVRLGLWEQNNPKYCTCMILHDQTEIRWFTLENNIAPG